MGLYTPMAMVAGIFFLVHHIIVKAGLFLVVGLVERYRGSFVVGGGCGFPVSGAQGDRVACGDGGAGFSNSSAGLPCDCEAFGGEACWAFRARGVRCSGSGFFWDSAGGTGGDSAVDEEELAGDVA